MDINEIEYIVVSHTEPDHAGSIEKLLDINPNIKIEEQLNLAYELRNIDIAYNAITQEGDE